MNNKSSKFNTTAIGILLTCVYIFFCFNAHDVVIPTKFSALALYALLGWGAFTVFLQRNAKISVYSMWYFVFMSWSLVIMTYSDENRILGGAFYLMIVSFVVTFIFQLFITNEKAFKMLSWSFAVSSLFLVASLHFTDNLVADANNRLGGEIMGNANTFALMIMCATMFELWLLVYGKYKKPVNVLLIAMVVLNYYALILSAGRKFFVMPIVFLYILLMYRTDKKGRKHILKYTILILALVLLLSWLIMTVEMFYNTIGRRMESLVEGTLGISQLDSSADIRETMRKLAIERWFEKPVFGHGFDSFKYLALSELRHFFYSHCNYTELLYNGGIIYFLIYYWIYYKLFHDTLVMKKGIERFRAFAVGTLVCLLAFDYGAVSYNLSYILIMLSMAFCALKFDAEKNDTFGGNDE